MKNIPAFPSVCLGDPGHPQSAPGMSLRDWFAGQALAKTVEWKPEHAAKLAYAYADAMLAARGESQ